MVIGYVIYREDQSIRLIMKCNNCGDNRDAILSYEKITRVKCKTCGRFDVIIPIEYYDKTRMVKDTITIGDYRYRKLRAKYKESEGGEGLAGFIRSEYKKVKMRQ